MTTDPMALLQRMPLFGALRDDALVVLLRQARAVQVPAGGNFFGEGDAADGLYVLQSGAASVYKGWGGQEVLLHRLQPGDCFGEMALMDLMPRSATVRADVDCRGLRLDSDDLYHLYQHDLEQFALLQMNLGREVSRRLRLADEELFHWRQSARDAQRPAA
jgi:CRP/FNR family transcriptional regulator, cyclic AMP receptor protein